MCQEPPRGRETFGSVKRAFGDVIWTFKLDFQIYLKGSSIVSNEFNTPMKVRLGLLNLFERV